ncbi:MAG: hypothetical protein U0228_29680 [Myxococcaceae bacterium]
MTDVQRTMTTVLGAIACLIGVGFTLFSLLVDRPRMLALREHGRQVTAWVDDRRVEERRSRKSSSTNFWVEVSYATKDAAPFALEAPEKKMDAASIIARLGVKPRPASTDAHATLNVPKDEFDSLNVGGDVEIVFVPGDDEAVFTARRVREWSVVPMLASGLVFLFIGAGVIAFARRGLRSSAAPSGTSR